MSEIKFHCPYCMQPLEAPATMAGQLIDCPKCGQAIEVAVALPSVRMKVVLPTLAANRHQQATRIPVPAIPTALNLFGVAKEKTKRRPFRLPIMRPLFRWFNGLDATSAGIAVCLGSFVLFLLFATPMMTHQYREYAETYVAPFWVHHKGTFSGLNFSIVFVEIFFAVGLGLMAWSMRRNNAPCSGKLVDRSNEVCPSVPPDLNNPLPLAVPVSPKNSGLRMLRLFLMWAAILGILSGLVFFTDWGKTFWGYFISGARKHLRVEQEGRVWHDTSSPTPTD